MRGTVLVVEDDPGVRRCLGEFLEGEGYQVISVAHGHAALAVLEDRLPDLMLIDVELPALGGWKLVEAVLHYPDLAQIPQVLMGQQDDLEGVLRRARQLLEKPLTAAA
jgi:CheY-like chemotaxis protein